LHAQGGRTADVLPPLLTSSHVRMKNNLKSNVPTEEKNSLENGLSRPCGIATGLKVRHVTARPERPVKRSLKIIQPCKGHNVIRLRPISSNEKPIKNAHFPSGTHRNQTRKIRGTNARFACCTVTDLDITQWIVPSSHQTTNRQKMPEIQVSPAKSMPISKPKSNVGPVLGPEFVLSKALKWH
jgi:hypothetical protein